MSGNTFGLLFTVTSFGESHGPAIGCVVDGCPPGMALDAAWIQAELDRRKPGTSRHVTQRREPDEVEILSGVFEGKTTGTPIALLIRNTDRLFRPGSFSFDTRGEFTVSMEWIGSLTENDLKNSSISAVADQARTLFERKIRETQTGGDAQE